MHTAERIELARLPSGIPVETTVHTYGSGDPTLYVQAAQHGREINGTEVLRRVHHLLVGGGGAGALVGEGETDDLAGDAVPDARVGDAVQDDLAGTLVTVPVADPLTFDRVSYTTPEALDAVHSNMNRCWPGDEAGTLHERMAARLWAYAEEADAIVDLHTGSPEMLTHTVFLHGNRPSRELAEAFGVDFLLAEAADEEADDEWRARGFEGKLRVAATGAGVPAITPELAHNKQLVAPAIESGVRGVVNVMRHVGVLDGEPNVPDAFTLARNHLGRVTADDSGLFVPADDLELGASVEAGDPLGRVYDPATYGVLHEVAADRAGTVYSITREATVTAGQSLVGVALPLGD